MGRFAWYTEGESFVWGGYRKFSILSPGVRNYIGYYDGEKKNYWKTQILLHLKRVLVK